ncbi:MAG TPA: PilZ domain-containing protein [Candidatus Manganitrophaceae bacterium]|nr:PilZ domain-containing protein [Candidatus Manganitrophaceae bacterium]
MEQRKHSRVPFFGKAKIVTGTRSFDVTISNVSLGGLLLHSNKTLELGQEMGIQVHGVYKGKKFEEKVTGKIVAVHRGNVGNSYGLQFSAYLESERQPSLFAWVTTSRKKGISSFLRDS